MTSCKRTFSKSIIHAIFFHIFFSIVIDVIIVEKSIEKVNELKEEKKTPRRERRKVCNSERFIDKETSAFFSFHFFVSFFSLFTLTKKMSANLRGNKLKLIRFAVSSSNYTKK